MTHFHFVALETLHALHVWDFPLLICRACSGEALLVFDDALWACIQCA